MAEATLSSPMMRAKFAHFFLLIFAEPNQQGHRDFSC
jgi:hypothetical protein